MNDFEYPNTRRIKYGDCGAQFLPVCGKCGRYVKPDETIRVNGEDEFIRTENATCKKCGRVEMIFEGYIH